MLKLKRRLLVSVVFALMLTVLVTTSAFAHYCTVHNKQEGAGSIGTYNIITGTFEPSHRPNGAFVTFTDGATFSYDVFIHDVLPEGALEAGPDGDNQCDGMGVDNALVCLGIPI